MSVFIKALLFVVVAEMGDKTQLMTVAMAAQFKSPIFILMGTTVEMLVADGIEILDGLIYIIGFRPNKKQTQNKQLLQQE